MRRRCASGGGEIEILFDLAEDQRVPVPVLPVDSGHFGLHGDRRVSIAGFYGAKIVNFLEICRYFGTNSLNSIISITFLSPV